VSWWESLYDDWLAEQLLERAPGEVDATIDFLTARLRIAPGQRVFDQCCGVGSVALPLAARGVRVVGVDQARGYVERASRAARDQGVDAEFFAGDARSFRPEGRVDAAFNWWTSFGYFEDDDENRELLARAFDALAPGGAFALDTMNVPGVLRAFQRDVVLRRRTARGDVTLLRESAVDLARGRMLKRWSYFVEGRLATERTSSVRLFMPDAIVSLLRQVGFADVELLGGIGGEPIGLDSPRLVAIARRPS
jgi:SAM-dependent methyltransferase